MKSQTVFHILIQETLKISDCAFYYIQKKLKAMKQTLKQELAEADAKISAMADTFKNPEKYCEMTPDQYVEHINSEAKRILADEKE